MLQWRRRSSIRPREHLGTNWSIQFPHTFMQAMLLILISINSLKASVTPMIPTAMLTTLVLSQSNFTAQRRVPLSQCTCIGRKSRMERLSSTSVTTHGQATLFLTRCADREVRPSLPFFWADVPLQLIAVQQQPSSPRTVALQLVHRQSIVHSHRCLHKSANSWPGFMRPDATVAEVLRLRPTLSTAKCSSAHAAQSDFPIMTASKQKKSNNLGKLRPSRHVRSAMQKDE